MRISHRTLRNALNIRVSPMVYAMAAVNVIIGFSFTVLTYLPEIQNSLLYKSGLLNGLVDFNLWGAGLFLGSMMVIVGLATRFRALAGPGAILGFMCWIFASITYIAGGFWYAFLTFSFFNMIFFVYICLAVSLKLLDRVAVSRLVNEDETYHE